MAGAASAVAEGSCATLLLYASIAGVSRTVPGARVASLAEHRHTIAAALDVLITGV